jgi:Putative restriction endonuclease
MPKNIARHELANTKGVVVSHDHIERFRTAFRGEHSSRGLVIYPRERAVEVLRFYPDLTQSAPEELTACAALMCAPDGIPAVAIIACYCGDLSEDEKVNLLPQGLTITECPVSTAGGVKAVDVAWLAPHRPEILLDPLLVTSAPEICIEILSPSNSRAEIDDKRALYFDAGAAEVWVCNLDGSLSFFLPPDQELSASAICPSFPTHIA